jgi:hypothetical protein
LVQIAVHKSLNLLAALVSATLLASCGKSPDAPAPELRRSPLIVVGIDGATWDVIDPMIAAGELPNFARLKQQGAWGPLITVGPQVSPVVWTTFATGHFGRQHGILDFVYPYEPGPKRPVQSTERQLPALWNLASDAGLSVAVTGYFVTYPAEQINGAMVSYTSPQKQPGTDYPADVLEPIRPQLDTIRSEEKSALWSRFLPWDFDPSKPPDASDPVAEAFRMVSGRVERRILHAEYNRRASLFLAKQPFDLFISYFALVDFASHSLWKYYDDSDFEQPADPETKRLLGQVIPESYRYMDNYLGELLDTLPDDVNLVIVSDHGFGSATGRFRVRGENRHRLNGNHRPNGLFIAAGPDFRPGRLDGMTIIDVFPLLAYLAGLPVADDLPADLDLRLITDQRLTAAPPEFVRSYATSGPSVVAGAEASREAQEDSVRALQGLGYVGESFELGESDTRAFDFWTAEEHLLLDHLSGELAFHLLKEDPESANALLSEARLRDEQLPAKLLNRGRVALDSIRETLAPEAVPESAFEFIAAARRAESETAEGGNP